MLSDTLKTETKPFHDAIEHNPFMQKIEHHTFTKEDYIALLKIFYALHCTLESQLEEYEELEMAKRERCSSLRADLLALGVDEHDLKRERLSDLSLQIDTLSKAYGALYIIEGSRMGGLFLTKLFRSLLGEEIPVSYFEGVKEQTALHVTRFKAQLDEKSPYLDEKECLKMAKETYLFVDYLFANAA